MPLVRTLGDRVEKFRAKTAPDRVGGRYEAAKELARVRFTENVSTTREIVERARNILESLGVPVGIHGIYYAFVLRLASMAQAHSGAALQKVVDGLKAWFVAKGADPAVLDKLAKLVA